jgi:SAM-dependent methyltransferase
VALDVPTVEALAAPAGRALVARATAMLDGGDDLVAVASRLRAEAPAGVATAALGQARLRVRARPRFGPLADRLLWTEAGLEQATRPAVATHRARRVAELEPAVVADLCCGVGGDLLALAAVAGHVRAVDRDPVTAAVARANAVELGLGPRVDVLVDDVTATDLGGCDVAFVDPARRAGGRRTFAPAAYQPPYAVAVELATRLPAGAVKVAPGIAHGLVPESAEAEWVSDGGDLKEATLWFGILAGRHGPARRRATLLPSEATLVDDPATPTPRTAAVGRWLHEPADAVLRAGLVAEVAAALDGWLLDERVAYVSTDAASASPFTRRYEVLDALPFSLPRLRTAVRAQDPSDVVVKTRGNAVDPEDLRRRLHRGGGGPALTVLLTRVGRAPLAVLARPEPT